jgi:hypothetical protein
MLQANMIYTKVDNHKAMKDWMVHVEKRWMTAVVYILEHFTSGLASEVHG